MLLIINLNAWKLLSGVVTLTWKPNQFVEMWNRSVDVVSKRTQTHVLFCEAVTAAFGSAQSSISQVLSRKLHQSSVIWARGYGCVRLHVWLLWLNLALVYHNALLCFTVVKTHLGEPWQHLKFIPTTVAASLLLSCHTFALSPQWVSSLLLRDHEPKAV